MRVIANASLLDKLEASRLRALETLSSVLFDNERDRGGGHPTPEVGVGGVVGDTICSPSRGGCTVGCKDKERRPATPTTRRLSLKELRRRAAILVQQERENLLHELYAELDLERRRFEARKPAISEEAYRAARAEHASALEKQEHELRMVLARREFKDLQDAARERLAIAHAQEKEKTLARLRRSLGRGTGHSVSGLRGKLWEEAHEKRTSQAKMEAMAVEATSAEQSALTALREAEEKVTSEGLARLTADLERERTEAEVELKRQLHREAARSVSLAVDACTAKHKRAQQEVTATAAEDLRRALQAAGEEEVARTKAVLGSPRKVLTPNRNQKDERARASATDGLASGLRDINVSSAARSSATGGGGKESAVDADGDGHDRDDDHDDAGCSSKAYAECAAAAARAVKAVRNVEGAATAAEREYAKRARSIVRLRSAEALRERNDNSTRRCSDVGGVGVSSASEREKGAGEGGGGLRTSASRESQGMADCDVGGRAEGGNGLVGCGGCAILFEANERLLEEAKARGFIFE
eukprot:g11099.t1